MGSAGVGDGRAQDTMTKGQRVIILCTVEWVAKRLVVSAAHVNEYVESPH